MNENSGRIVRVDRLSGPTLSSATNGILRSPGARENGHIMTYLGQFLEAQEKRRGDSRLGAGCKLPDQPCSLPGFQLPGKDDLEQKSQRVVGESSAPRDFGLELWPVLIAGQRVRPARPRGRTPKILDYLTTCQHAPGQDGWKSPVISLVVHHRAAYHAAFVRHFQVADFLFN